MKRIVLALLIFAFCGYSYGQTVTTKKLGFGMRYYVLSPDYTYDEVATMKLGDTKIGMIGTGKEYRVIDYDTINYIFYKVEYKKGKVGLIHRGIVENNVIMNSVDPGIREQFRPDCIRGNVAIGMNDYEVRCSVGEPSERNTTTTEGGTHEQLVYGGGYIYLDNGYVSSIQTSTRRAY